MRNVQSKDILPLTIEPRSIELERTNSVETPLHVTQLLAILRRGARTIGAFAIVGVTLALLIGLLIPIKYMSIGYLAIDPAKWPREVDLTTESQSERTEAALPQDAMIDAVMDTHEMALNANAFMERVARILSPARGSDSLSASETAPAAMSIPPKPFGLEELSRRMTIWLDMLHPGKTADLDGKRLGKSIKIFRDKHSLAFVINGFAETPERAAAYVNTLMNVYVAERLEERRAVVAREFGQVEARIATLKRLASTKSNQARQMIRAGAPSSSSQNDFFDQRLREAVGEVSATRSLLPPLERRQASLRGQLENLKADVGVMAYAVAPGAPNTPHPLLFAVPALILSLILGSMWVVVREHMNDTFHGEADVEGKLQAPLIGLTPEVSSGSDEPERYLIRWPRSVFAESIRFIVCALGLANPTSRARIILISSCLPGAGKSSLARCLATSVARLGRKTILVDFDLRSGRALDFGVTSPESVVTFPLKDDFEYAIQGLPEFRCDFLRIRKSESEPLNMFAEDQVPKMFRRLGEIYDCVLVDGPPLMLLSEARLLASLVDQVVIAVRWGTTRDVVAANALKQLRGSERVSKRKIDVGVVLTHVNLKRHAFYGYGDIGQSFAAYRGREIRS